MLFPGMFRHLSTLSFHSHQRDVLGPPGMCMSGCSLQVDAEELHLLEEGGCTEDSRSWIMFLENWY